MIRKRRYKPGDKVILNRNAVVQNEFNEMYPVYNELFQKSEKGEVIRIEEMLPENSNFRYSVKFQNNVLTLNEIQIDSPG